MPNTSQKIFVETSFYATFLATIHVMYAIRFIYLTYSILFAKSIFHIVILLPV